ncbi:MAG: S-layer homology domain-containing protein [Paenibacillaceae bacterium]|nr:S-layer homology domain-containing protein [Paenibacillaceae bacterium]
MLLCGVGTAASAYDSQLKPFPDVPAGDWGEESVYALSAVGIISGYDDGTFRPDDQVTREAFLKMLVTSWQEDAAADEQPGAAGGSTPMQPIAPPPPATEPALPPLAGLSPERWSYPFVERAYEEGLLGAMIDGGAFQPDKPMTREEVAVAVGRELFGHMTANERRSWSDSGWKAERQARAFADDGEIDVSQAVYAYLTAHAAIMVGDAGRFRPDATLTRREAAAILYRTINERSGDAPLDVTGFYAISSYADIDKLDALRHVAFGWSHLDYAAPGAASLNVDTTEYKLPADWQSAVQAAQAAGVSRDLMVYANNEGRMLDAFLGDSLAQMAFLASLQEKLAAAPGAFTGVTLDWEGLLDERLQNPYVDFLRQVKRAIGDLPLTVAVQPTFYYKGYDMAAIGALADRVILMAYDFTYDPDRLPSAPLPLVGETVAAVLRDVPRSKLVLGISKQANQWTTAADGVTASAKPTADLVEARLKAEGVQAQTEMPYFLRHITFRDQRGAHEIWYEDADAIARKLWLARYYGLSGVSLWRMGLFTEQDWGVIGQAGRVAG